MLRIAGTIMIMSGCMGLGMWYRQQFIQRLQCLRTLQQILELLMGEVRYGKATLPECCRRIGERQEEPYKESLCSIYQRMEANHGESFQTVFCEQMSACLDKRTRRIFCFLRQATALKKERCRFGQLSGVKNCCSPPVRKWRRKIKKSAGWLWDLEQ